MVAVRVLYSLMTLLKSKLGRRKGLDKPIFLVATLTLAIMFLMAYYLATTGWMDSVGQLLMEQVDKYEPNPGG